MLRAILVDDDESNLSALREKLARHCPEVEVIGSCDNGADGIAMIEEQKPGIVFLDIEMPLMNGFVMLQQLHYRDFALVFVTAYDHYAIKAIRYSALDYLVKPVEIEELKSAVARALANQPNQSSQVQLEILLEQLHKKQPQRISIPTSDGLRFLQLDQVVHLEASSNYTYIYLATKQHFLVSRTLKEFEDMLPPEIFIRIHHATIINKNYVEKYIRGEGGQVLMQDGKVLDVSKRKKGEFLQAISGG
jgi:two-component system LytT family response regulator